MSLGKWVMMLRETTKALQALQDLNAASTIPELVEFYHGKKGKENAKLIDKLVSIRNDDAHGNPIPEEKLKAELDSRQKLIDSLLEELTFLKNYQLILPETLSASIASIILSSDRSRGEIKVTFFKCASLIILFCSNSSILLTCLSNLSACAVIS